MVPESRWWAHSSRPILISLPAWTGRHLSRREWRAQQGGRKSLTQVVPNQPHMKHTVLPALHPVLNVWQAPQLRAIGTSRHQPAVQGEQADCQHGPFTHVRATLPLDTGIWAAPPLSQYNICHQTSSGGPATPGCNAFQQQDVAVAVGADGFKVGVQAVQAVAGQLPALTWRMAPLLCSHSLKWLWMTPAAGCAVSRPGRCL